MTDNEFLLQDRLQKIRQIIDKYGENNFYLSFSGGKDSTVLSALVDMALPYNKIPRVYANTGIEYKMIMDFVKGLAETDDRIVILKPQTPIKQMLETEGYPFKSKKHSRAVREYKSGRGQKFAQQYYNGTLGWTRTCPKILKYQFEQNLPFKISEKCCDRLKKDKLKAFQKESRRPYAIIGIMPDEGGQRESAKCLAFSGKKLKAFQPLVPVTKDWEDWLIDTYNIEICDIYKPPYNFTRTGCKGCPFALNLQEELDTLEKFFPEERKQCEIIWKPVYDEYRRIGYRLKEETYQQMSIEDFIKEDKE